MGWTIAKLAISAAVISLTSWLAGKKPALAGFLLALPISTLLALAFNHLEYRDPEKSVTFARAVLVGVPLSLTFFVPFLFADRMRLGFWGLYLSGMALLVVSYGIHRALLGE